MRLLGDSILITPDEVDETTPSGLHLPGGSPVVFRTGVVAHVGPGRRSEYTGELIPVDVEVGDKVIYHHAHGQPVEFGDEKYWLLAPSQVLGFVGEKADAS